MWLELLCCHRQWLSKTCLIVKYLPRTNSQCLNVFDFLVCWWISVWSSGAGGFEGLWVPTTLSPLLPAQTRHTQIGSNADFLLFFSTEYIYFWTGLDCWHIWQTESDNLYQAFMLLTTCIFAMGYSLLIFILNILILHLWWIRWTHKSVAQVVGTK